MYCKQYFIKQVFNCVILIIMKLWLTRGVHVSWLIAVFALAVSAGVIAAGDVKPDYFYSYAWLIVGLMLAVIGFWRRRRWVVLVLLVGGCLLGLWRGSIVRFDGLVYENLLGQTLTIRGKVLEDADVSRQGQTVLRMGKLSEHGRALPGKLWVTMKRTDTIKRSDIVTVRGKIKPGFSSFSGAAYRAELVGHERAAGADMARELRDKFSDNVRGAVGEPEVSLGLGFLTGQRRGLPPDLQEALKIAGLTHIIVASGYNLTILIRIARRAFAKSSKYLATAVPAVLIVGFIAVTGLSPSMSRAGLVAGLSLLAWCYGRKFHPAVLLALVAAVSLLIDPSYGWGDLGWYLSFAAFVGVMVVSPLMHAYFYGEHKPILPIQIAFETTAAFITTLPIIVVSFGQISNVAILTNMLILPFVPLAMLGIFVVGLAALVHEGLAELLGEPVSWLLGYMVHVAEFAAGLNWAQTEYEAPFWQLLVFYGALGAVCFYFWKVTHYRLGASNIIE